MSEDRIHFGTLDPAALLQRSKAQAAHATGASGEEAEQPVVFDKDAGLSSIPTVGAAAAAAGAAASTAARPPVDEDRVMELSETSKQAQEKHAAMLMALEIERRARTAYVPADVEEAKKLCRELGMPVTLFGEGPAERRERLKRAVAEKEVQEQAEAGTLVTASSTVAAATIAAAASSRAAAATVAGAAAAALAAAPGQAELFYTPSSEQLQQARKEMAVYSFSAAQRRLERQRCAIGDPLMQQEEDQLAAGIYRCMKRARPLLSQAGDDRPLTACALSRGGQQLATGSWGSTIKVWPAAGRQAFQQTSCLLRGHKDRCTGLDWHPNSGAHSQLDDSSSSTGSSSCNLLLSGSIDGTAKLWRVPTEPVQASGENSGLSDSALREVRTFIGHSLRLAAVAWHPCGRYLGTSSWDTSWRLWDAETAQELLLQEGHARECHALSFHTDGSLVATGDLGGVTRVWDLRSGKSIMVLQGHTKQVLTLDFSPNGYQLASGSDDNTCIIWDLRSQRSTYTLPAHAGLVSKVKWAPHSGEYLVTASYDATLRCWSSRDWSPLVTLKGHEGKVACVDVFPDEKQLVSVAFDRTIKVWGE